jgi:hypothetical protein
MLDSLCRSKSWDVSDLGNLGLLGVQPCFEDVVLLTPVYISVTALSIYRCWQCYQRGPYNSNQMMKLSALIKFFLCIFNLFANIVLIGLVDQPAPYEALVAPFSMIAWISMGAMCLVPYFWFSFIGQWISRFVFIWMFLVTTIRWPSQRALGNISGQSYYFNGYITIWTVQLILVIFLYFERPVLQSEFEEVSGGIDEEVGQSGLHGDIQSTMSFKQSISLMELNSNEIELINRNEAVVFNKMVETTDMKPVPWTNIVNPEENSNIFSFLVYGWMTPLFKYANKNTIEDYDIWDLRPKFR